MKNNTVSSSLWALLAVAASACANDVAPAGPASAPEIVAFGRDTGRGNLLGVQPWLEALDYATPERLDTKLRAWLDAAAMQGLVGARTVVVFPEYMGTWLVAVTKARMSEEAKTIGDAMTALAGAHALDFAAAMAGAPADDGMAYAAFAVRAGRMAEVHEQIFSAIARDYGVTVTGASTLLPGPHVQGGHIVITPGEPLENVVFTFHADGSLDPSVTRKAFPTASEQPFVKAASVDDIPVIDTPAGALGVLVCAGLLVPRQLPGPRRQGRGAPGGPGVRGVLVGRAVGAGTAATTSPRTSTWTTSVRSPRPRRGASTPCRAGRRVPASPRR